MNEIEEIIDTTRNVLNRIHSQTDCILAGYDDCEDLKNKINFELNELEKGNSEYLIKVYSHYLPTSTFQEIYIDKDWETEYFDTAARMDELFARLKPRKNRNKTFIEKVKSYFKN